MISDSSSDERIEHDLAVRRAMAILLTRGSELTDAEAIELTELLEPYSAEDSLELFQALQELRRADRDPMLIAGCLYRHLAEANLLTTGEALTAENQWMEGYNQLRRDRGEIIDPDGPPAGAL